MKKEFFTYLNTTLTGKLPLAEVSVHLTAASGFLLRGGFLWRVNHGRKIIDRLRIIKGFF